MYKIPTTRAELSARLDDILVEQLGIDKGQAKPSDTLEELGADSLDTVELVMAFEEEFNIEISDENLEQDLAPNPSVQAVDDYLAKRLGLTV